MPVVHTVLFLAAMFALSSPTGSFAQPNQEASEDGRVALQWEVVNRFPVFKNSEWFARLAGIPSPEGVPRNPVWPIGASAESVITNPAVYTNLRSVLPPSKDTAWDEERQQYDKSVLFRKTAQISAISSLKGPDCIWEVTSKLSSGETKPVTQLKGACSQSPYLTVPDIGVDYDLQVVQLTPPARISTPVRIKTKLIVALGDSFASGEGNPDHPAKFNAIADRKRGLPHDWFLSNGGLAVLSKENSAQWWSQSCHRSLLSWPAMAALKRAIHEKDSIVQFASFACSGAEVYDGLLNPQIEPPGYEYLPNPTAGFIPVKHTTGDSDTVTKVRRVTLKYSQIQALSDLICDAPAKPVEQVYQRTLQPGVRHGQRDFYGAFDTPQCKSRRLTVDNLYFMFGGNDTGFSSVVSGAIFPQDLKYEGLVAKPFQGLVNNGLFQRLRPVSPQAAASKGIPELPKLFDHLSKELKSLGVRPEATLMVGYPDLIQDLPSRSAEERKNCALRTADGFSPFQVLVGKFARHDGARFGLRTGYREESESLLLKAIRDDYISPLRKAMEESRSPDTWQYVDSNSVFLGRDICAKPPGCSHGQCPQGGRVRWAWSHLDRVAQAWSPLTCEARREESAPGRKGPISQIIHDCSVPAWTSVSDFQLYDPSKQAGVRLATDAILGAARLDRATHSVAVTPFAQKKPHFTMDGLFGSAHPTAHMHAAIADLVQP